MKLSLGKAMTLKESAASQNREVELLRGIVSCFMGTLPVTNIEIARHQPEG